MKAYILLLTATSLVIAVLGDNNNGRHLQSSNPRVIAEAFECDDNMEEIQDTTTPRKIGHEIRICVQPNSPTRNRNVVMRSIDEFTFYKNFGSTMQKVIENRVESESHLTLLLCIPGQTVCSFKTRMLDDFFYSGSNGNATGSGTVSMEFADTSDRRILTGSIGFRKTQVSAGYAGSDGITIRVPVEGVPKPNYVAAEGEEDISSWWQTSPTWLKILSILAILNVLLLMCCLFGLCCYTVRKRIADEEKKKEEEKNEAEERALDDDYMDATSSREHDDGIRISVAGPRNSVENEYEFIDLSVQGSADDEDVTDMPTDNDVCFDADDHPGTIEMKAAIDATIQKNPDDDYSPSIYRQIKRQMLGRRFFICDDENQPGRWREVAKKELVELLRREFTDVKKKYNA
jgi:hypothetical protein